MRKILRGRVFIKHILFTLGLGFSFLCDTNAQVSGTFTINRLAATGGSNFNSFAAAVASLSGGVNGAVTFNVVAGSGPYNEQVILNAIPGTSATNTITFNCNGQTLSFLSTDYNQRAGIKLNGADYVTFDNLNVTPQADQAGEYGYGFHLLNDADHNTIKNCHITNFVDSDNPDDHEGIVINGSHAASWEPGDSYCDDNLIQNNTITGGTIAVSLNSTPISPAPGQFITGNRIIGNTFSNNIYYAIQMYYTSGTVIDGNDITGGPDATSDLIGMFLDFFNYSFSIINNKIHGFHLNAGSRATGLYIASESIAGQTCLIANNLIYDFQTSGRVYGINATQSQAPTYATSFLNVYNNTISLDDQSVAGSDAFGMYFGKIANVSVMNNIITVTRNSANSNYGIYFDTDPLNYASQRNVIYVPNGPATTDAVGYIQSTNYTTVNAWYKATGYDYYSTDVNPGYTNPAGYNFRPTTQSIDNLGALLGVLADIDGATRNTTNPDIGCYEFISTACSPAITGGSINVLPDSILCSGPQIALGLTGNSAGGGQTYVWQSSTTQNGAYSNISGTLGYPYMETIPTATRYYRVALTCGATTVFSSPKRVLVNTTLNAGTYTINSAQPTGGLNFSSFTDAAQALQCGLNGSVVFNVASGSGPYNEQLLLPELPTSPAKTVTFNCNGVTIAFAPVSVDSSAVVKLNGSDYITIDSLNVEVLGSSTFGFGIQLRNDADHNTIKRCTVNVNKTSTSLFYAGIVINPTHSEPIGWVGNSYCDSNLIANNTVIGGTYGISVVSNSLTIGFSSSLGNIIKNNTVKDSYLSGIYLSGLANTLVDSNDISQPTRTVLASYAGIFVFQKNYNVTISRNRIHHLAESVKNANVQFEGIRCDNIDALPAEPVVVTNNLMHTWRGSGMQYGLNNIYSNHIRYYHNTISLDDSSSASPSVTRGFGTFGSITDGVEVKNNNFFIRRGGSGKKHCIYTNLNDAYLIANNNNYYIYSTVPGTAYTGFFIAADYLTLADWQTTGKDAASIAIDPVFENIATGDYTPTKIPFENKGSNVGITTDLNGFTRNTATPDIGAIEFTICRALTQPVLSVAEQSVNTITFAWTAVPGTSGYRVSRDGINWTVPSSGAMGTSHVVVGLKPTDTANLIVKALGARVDCPGYLSQMEQGKAQTDQVFIPNTFSPNGNTWDETFRVYSNVMKTMRLMVFNQWGAKIFETNDPKGFWDGTYKGKPQPVGVYVYVVVGTLSNGAKINQKGTFNLIR
jgi:gliding motility-associated-like protein